MGTAEEVAGDLRAEMIDSLHAEGLTRDEAASMVATWDDLWFTEPGTRILAILPQAFADKMVPLAITPKPTKIDRVFVARVEILTREVEEQLTSLLRPRADEGDESEFAEDVTRLADIQLGRYAAGGMERAVQLLEREDAGAVREDGGGVAGAGGSGAEGEVRGGGE